MKDSPTWFTRWKTFLRLALIAALTVVAGQTRGGTCTPPPAGLVGWWKGDGDTLDSISGNSGVKQNIAYTNGVDGLAFACDPENYPYGTYTGIQIADQPVYALTNSLTIEGWVRPRGDGYIVFWRGDNRPGMDPYYLSMHGDSSHAIDFGITDAAGNNAFVETTLNYFTWTHLAATLDGDSGTLSIYTNGVLAAQTNTTVRPFGNLIPEDSPGVSIGNLNDGGNNFPFFGDIDEISLYARALSLGEIQAIYNAGSAGKCTTNESTNNCVTSPSDLAGWWPAEGNASDVVNGNNGTLVGGASFAPGKVGLGFRFDGTNSFVQIPDSDALKPTNVTCEAWVWLDPGLPSNNGGEQIVFKKNTWSAWFEGYSLLKTTIDNGNGTYSDRFQFCVSRYGNQVAINSQTIAQRGVWYHVAGTYDGNESKLYVNGVLEASATPGFPLDYDTTPIFIGTSGTWAPYLSMFGGIIDETSIYSRALSADEIQAIYNADNAGKCTSTVQPKSLLLNVDFGVGNGRGYSLKTGFAAVGLATNDFWNYYDRDGTTDPNDWRYFGVLTNLQTAGGIATIVGIAVSDAPGGYGTSSADPMYAGYVYPLDGGINIVTFTNLPPGNYDVLAYSADGNYEITVGATSYGVKTTYDPSPTGVPVWTEGVQYARWNDVAVSAGQTLALTVRNGTGGYAILSGIQLLSSQQSGVPVISSQPASQTVAVGGSADFSVAVSGAMPLSFQWSLNLTNIGGATNATLTLTNIQPEQAGNYSVLVSNFAGSATSSNAVLTIYVPAIPPAIVSQTPNQVVLLGNPANFSVNAEGSEPLSYFWLRNNVLILEATNASYSLPNAQLADSGSQFYCLVTNAYGVASSTNVTLKVIDTIANDLCSGAIVISNGSYTNVQSTLKASSFGDPVPDCVDGFGHGVWYQFTAPVAGRLIVDTLGSDFDTGLAVYTGSRDALTEVACNDDFGGVTSQVTFPTTAGTTYFILVGGYGSDAGNLVLHLNHQTPPAFAVQPVDESIIVNSNASFNAVVTGALPMSFQWYFGATPLMDDGRISGSTTASLSISNSTTADAGSYSLAVTNFLGSTNSTAAVLTVLVPPSITLNPVGRSVPPGLPTTFSASASGVPAPVYQWQLNGTNIPGATNSIPIIPDNISRYSVPAVGTNELGFYRLVASNFVGVAVSADAQLTFGPVAAWGRNSDGESLPPPGLSNVVAVAGSTGASFAICSDGTIVSWGSGAITNVPISASNVVALSVDNFNYGAAALRSDGSVISWGQIPDAGPTVSNVVSTSVGFDFAVTLRTEGTLNTWLSYPPLTPGGLDHLSAIAFDYIHSLVLRNDGTVVSWGAAAAGSATNVPAGLAGVMAIAVGDYNSLVLKSNGTIVAWGSGSGTKLPVGLSNITAISTVGFRALQGFPSLSLALRSNGTFVAWGDSLYGETNPPTALSNLVSVAVAAAPYHGLALVNDGSPVILHPPVGLTAYWGRDVMLHGDAAGAQPLSYQWLFNGANIPGATNNVLAIPNLQSGNAGNYQLFVSNSIGTTLSLAAPLTVASNNILTFLSQPPAAQTNYQGSKATLGVTVLGSGPVNYQWSYSTNIQAFYTAIPGATNDTLVFDPALAGQSGYYRVVASNKFYTVTSSSTYLRVLFAKSWGYLAKDPSFDVTNAIAIAVGNGGQGSPLGHYLALKSDGKISSWSGSFAQYGETNVSALSNSFVTAIAAGYQDSLALKSDGTLYAWGFGIYGETNLPSGLSGVTAIACGDYHDLALKSDGTVAGWGQNNFQQTTNAAATNVVAITAGGVGSMALRADGSVVTWGSYGTQPPFFVNTTNNIAIAAGAGHFLALRTNGTVIGWGNNSYGQTTIPAGISNIVAISAGANHSVLLRNDGSIITLGSYAGQTTLGAPSDLANVVAIASSGDHDLALFGTRAPAFTVHPWNRSVPYLTTGVTNIVLTGKCSGVQPVSYQWQLNGTNYPGATNDSLALRGDPPSRIPVGAYRLIASNAYGVVASKFAKVTTFYPLANALDTPTDAKAGPLYNWTTSGNAQWFGETNITHDGVDAAQSGGIGALQETILQTTIGTNWSGSCTFWWKVSSEEDFDYLEFSVNGITQASISGLSDWQEASIHVDAYTNVLQWRYSKDASFDSGLDAGWVDQFAFVPDPPKITVQPVSQTVNMGDTVKLMVTATGPNSLPGGGPPGSSLRYQWRQNGQNIGNSSSLALLTLNNVGRAQAGIYSVTVTNFSLPSNSIVSSNAVLKVLVPQLLGQPVLLPDGSFQLTSTDANGGGLKPSDLANFEAQASTNLVDWVTLPNALSLTKGTLLLQDGGQSNYPTRFYRLLEH